MQKPEVSIILPSLNRSARLSKALLNLRASTHNVDTELVIVLDEDDITSQSTLTRDGYRFILTPPRSTPIFKWNFGAAFSNGEWLYQCSDDIHHPDNWLKRALATPNHGFLALSDGLIRPFSPFYMAKRDWLKRFQNGTLAVPHYKHWGNDVEIAERARRIGHYVVAEGVKLTHLHYLYGKARRDSTYKLAEINYQDDLDLLAKRRALGFPDDFKPVF